MSNWINVNDGLPIKNDHVLVFCEGGNIVISYFILDRVFAAQYHRGGGYSRKYSNKQSCHFDIAHSSSYKITHWMPRPAPPRGLK